MATSALGWSIAGMTVGSVITRSVYMRSLDRQNEVGHSDVPTSVPSRNTDAHSSPTDPPAINFNIPVKSSQNLWAIITVTCGTSVTVWLCYHYYLQHQTVAHIKERVSSAEEHIHNTIVNVDQRNATRISHFDANMDARIQDSKHEIRSELSAGFDQISSQVFILSQLVNQMFGQIVTNADGDAAQLVKAALARLDIISTREWRAEKENDYFNMYSDSVDEQIMDGVNDFVQYDIPGQDRSNLRAHGGAAPQNEYGRALKDWLCVSEHIVMKIGVAVVIVSILGATACLMDEKCSAKACSLRRTILPVSRKRVANSSNDI